ncbi:HAD-like protein [Ramaria rubella]|nr:HAD-like protein [Ramaria rubella]
MPGHDHTTTMVARRADGTIPSDGYLRLQGSRPAIIQNGPQAAPCCTRFTSVIVDLGDVLFTWSSSSSQSRISSRTFKHICRSATYFEYQKGHLSKAEAYSRIAEEYELSVSDLQSAFSAARDSLKTNTALFDLMREIKDSGRRIYAMSNIAGPDCDSLAEKVDPSYWALFDKVFTSAAAHERKPNLGFYKYVLTETGLDPTSTIFVDDKIENVLSARSFGMHGIVFNDPNTVMRQLRNLCGDPIERAKAFLTANKKQLQSVTSKGYVMKENYSQLLIWETTGDESLVEYVDSPRLVNFFPGPCPEELLSDIFWKEEFPDDLDDTAVALTVSPNIDAQTKHSVMDEMLLYRNQEGIVFVYFDDTRPRIDPAVCINVLTLFYRNGRGHELEANLSWVYDCLLHRAYLNGTLYYTTPEVFLFFLSRLVESSSRVRELFEPVFRERISERFGAEGDSLAIAMRMVAAASVGLVSPHDLDKLQSMQQNDGSWTDGWYYRFGSTGILVGNVGLTTAMAIKAIEVTGELIKRGRTASPEVPAMEDAPSLTGKLGSQKAGSTLVAGKLDAREIATFAAEPDALKITTSPEETFAEDIMSYIQKITIEEPRTKKQCSSHYQSYSFNRVFDYIFFYLSSFH